MTRSAPVRGPVRTRPWLDRGRSFLDFFLPSACIACRQRIPLDREQALVCDTCASRLRPPPGPGCRRCGFPMGTRRAASRPCLQCREWPDELAEARAAVVLEPPADILVHALKYEGWRELAPVLAARMRPLLHALDPDAAAVLVPVPTTGKRLRTRGYSQAAVLARALAEDPGRPVFEALRRRPSGSTQVSLHPTQRRANVQNAFTTVPECRQRLQNHSVIVVDDVLTTGATAGAVAQVLVDAGARSVRLLTFARSLPHRRRATR